MQTTGYILNHIKKRDFLSNRRAYKAIDYLSNWTRVQQQSKWHNKWKLVFKILFYWTKSHWKNLWKICISGKYYETTESLEI